MRRVAAQLPVLWITGARQTGKTTLLRHLAAKSRRSVPLDERTAALPFGAL